MILGFTALGPVQFLEGTEILQAGESGREDGREEGRESKQENTRTHMRPVLHHSQQPCTEAT